MGSLLQLIGAGWAIIGIANFCSLSNQKPLPSDTALGLSFMFQALLFVFPGLLLAGIGSSIKSKKIKSENIPIATFEKIKKCPFCAETIKEEAVLCRFCGKDV